MPKPESLDRLAAEADRRRTVIHMTRRLLAYAILPAALCLAQTATQPTFEVASIKRGTPGNGSSWRVQPGRLTMENESIKQIVQAAYSLQDYQYSGPAWLEGERYNIDAKADHRGDGKQLLLMLQNLLSERFKLVVHHESKSMPGYALVLAKSGLKIRAVEGEGSNTNESRNKLTATHIDMARFTKFLANLLSLPVVDETGVKDSFSFVLQYVNPRSERTEKADGDEVLPTIFTALTEQLGLKLETRKVPVDVLVVDRAERPSEN
jgi:uncharacterized protein (TIGR03435 family)